MTARSAAGVNDLRRQRDIAIRGSACTLVEDPDRLEPAHVRHDDVDDHQIEPLALACAKPGLAFGNRHPKIVALETELDGHADHRVVVDNENRIDSLSPFEFLVAAIQQLDRGYACLLRLGSK
jgi:hypothetical protein